MTAGHCTKLCPTTLTAKDAALNRNGLRENVANFFVSTDFSILLFCCFTTSGGSLHFKSWSRTSLLFFFAFDWNISATGFFRNAVCLLRRLLFFFFDWRNIQVRIKSYFKNNNQSYRVLYSIVYTISSELNSEVVLFLLSRG